MSLRRVYETTIIVNAALDDADIESVVSRLQALSKTTGPKYLRLTNGDVAVWLIR